MIFGPRLKIAVGPVNSTTDNRETTMLDRQFERRAVLVGLSTLLGSCATARLDLAAKRDTAALALMSDFPAAPMGPAFPLGPLKSIAISSCCDETRPAPLYDDIRKAKPDLLLLLGDNVYGSATPDDPQLSDLRAAYWQMARKPEFRALIQDIPNLAIWDDHDFGKNDGGGDFPHKALAQKMFNAFWNISPTSPLRSREGLYRSVRIGPAGKTVQIIMLDTRYFRDPMRRSDHPGTLGRERYIPHDVDARADILGEVQWTWLEAILQEPADIRIIVSSIQVIGDGHGYERWSQFPFAQQRLFRLIPSTRAKGVIFVSGDRHIGALNKLQTAATYPFFDLTASSINTSNWTQSMPIEGGDISGYKVGPSYAPENYGVIDIDWAGQSLQLGLVGTGQRSIKKIHVAFSQIGW